jgi:aminopeptidase-like protein
MMHKHNDRNLNMSELIDLLSSVPVGDEMYRLICELYPFCRSITGNGVRETLRAVGKRIPLNIHEVPTGTQVLDWTIPKEWNIKDAYIADSRGRKVVDFANSNLHVVSYSVPIKKRMPLDELKKHIFTLAEHPDWVPFRASYYKENWGFCLSHNELTALRDDEYEVCIDSSLQPGFLTYGEYLVPGERADEVLVSCHTCHPSLCNDNLSGIALATILAQYLSQAKLRFSYRFLYIPSTIGSISWLSLNESQLSNIKHGLVIACVGDSGKLTYKKSRRGDAELDKAILHALKHSGQEYEVMDFSPYGYDERQFCSPGFNLPVGCLMRTPYGRYPEYHTSADNLDFVRPPCLADSLLQCLSALSILENNEIYVNQNPKGEPQLGKRGLYRGYPSGGTDDMALLWVLNLSDGDHTLLDIAERAGIAFAAMKKAADALLACDLLKKISNAGCDSRPTSDRLGQKA